MPGIQFELNKMYAKAYKNVKIQLYFKVFDFKIVNKNDNHYHYNTFIIPDIPIYVKFFFILCCF